MNHMQIQKAEEQLKLWAQAPSPTEMKKIQHTREMIENALKRNLPLEEIKRNYNLVSIEFPSVYLQGSYANSTNIRFDSDVDIVVQLNSLFWSDTSQLSGAEQLRYACSAIVNSSYFFHNFKDDIFRALQTTFGSAVEPSGKCIKVKDNTSRVTADVIPCYLYKIYKRYHSYLDEPDIEGVKFFDTNTWTEIINFPKLHIRNCEFMNLLTKGAYKSVVRIFKNIKSILVDEGILDDKIAPSYFIENLIYNCSYQCFQDSLVSSTIKVFQYLFDAMKSVRISGFKCANEQDSLFSDRTWNTVDAQTFLLKTAEFHINVLEGRY